MIIALQFCYFSFCCQGASVFLDTVENFARQKPTLAIATLVMGDFVLPSARRLSTVCVQAISISVMNFAKSCTRVRQNLVRMGQTVQAISETTHLPVNVHLVSVAIHAVNRSGNAKNGTSPVNTVCVLMQQMTLSVVANLDTQVAIVRSTLTTACKTNVKITLFVLMKWSHTLVIVRWDSVADIVMRLIPIALKNRVRMEPLVLLLLRQRADPPFISLVHWEWDQMWILVTLIRIPLSANVQMDSKVYFVRKI